MRTTTETTLTVDACVAGGRTGGGGGRGAAVVENCGAATGEPDTTHVESTRSCHVKPTLAPGVSTVRDAKQYPLGAVETKKVPPIVTLLAVRKTTEWAVVSLVVTCVEIWPFSVAVPVTSKPDLESAGLRAKLSRPPDCTVKSPVMTTVSVVMSTTLAAPIVRSPVIVHPPWAHTAAAANSRMSSLHEQSPVGKKTRLWLTPRHRCRRRRGSSVGATCGLWHAPCAPQSTAARKHIAVRATIGEETLSEVHFAFARLVVGAVVEPQTNVAQIAGVTES